MRWSEIVESQVDEAAANLPQKYLVDDATDLALNLPNQWSQSPYLGAVKNSKGQGYMAQIHIPQAVWSSMVDQNPAKWSKAGAPAGFFNPTGNQRPSMRVPFQDPRQAAWFAQEVLYGGDIAAREVIEDFFEEVYKIDGGRGEVWRGLLARVPNFDGEILTSADEQAFFADRESHQKHVTQQKNASNYEGSMLPKIRKALVDFYTKNQALAKKRLGASLNEIPARVDQAIKKHGVEYFVTSPGSVKLKDVASLAL